MVTSNLEYDEIVLFENLQAGGSGPDWRDLLQRNGVDVTRTISDLDALNAQAPGREGLLLVAGGDGTLNEAISRVLDRGCTVGVLPGGTGNDFARTLGMPLNAEQACQALKAAVEHTVDVAEINDQILLNAAHIGVGSVISGDAGRFKGAWGRLSYLRALTEQLFGRSSFQATIRLPEHVESNRWRNITIANGRFFGGGHAVYAEARLDDELLDVIAFKKRPWWQLMWAAFLKRCGFDYPEALRHWRVARVEIETNHAHPVVVDGDVRTRTSVKACVRPAILRVLVGQAGPGLGESAKEQTNAA